MRPLRCGDPRSVFHGFKATPEQKRCVSKWNLQIAHIVGISQSTLSRELKRNSSPSGKYVCFKAHDKAMERRKRSTSNAALAPELVWRIKQAIIGEQWSPRQISGVLKREGVSVSHQSIYKIIHADTTGEVRRLLPYRKHIKTITTDNGPEFAAHKQITEYLGAVVYFADPYASW